MLLFLPIAMLASGYAHHGLDYLVHMLRLKPDFGYGEEATREETKRKLGRDLARFLNKSTHRPSDDDPIWDYLED